MTEQLRWGSEALAIEIAWGRDSAPYLAAAQSSSADLTMPTGLPLVEITSVSHGHSLASDRLIHTSIGESSRYVSHRVTDDSRSSRLELTMVDATSGLESLLTLVQPHGTPAFQATVVVRNTGLEAVRLRSVATFSTYLGDARSWILHHGRSDWLAEGRWTRTAVPGPLFPSLSEELTHHNPRGEFSVLSTGAWSTGKHLPVAVASSADIGAAWAWQVEHNGAWRWEVGHDTGGDYVSLSGPTHVDHNWLKTLAPGESFESVPVALALGSDFESAVGALTDYRRATRRSHADNARLGVVFNDYMNTLNGDPTAEKLLPLIEAAADAGAEIFCIDAGWYDDDGGDWWDGVGEWKPSTTRFPNGLAEVIHHITARGMIPGLWLEPEVVGVNSPVADRLPFEAFLRIGNDRLVEQRRYHLDLRHSAATDHLDEVVDRLIRDFGIGYFKLDYNIDPGTGTENAEESSGSALLEHNRAHLAWLDGVLDRHPELILENCASGAMRSDWAMMSRLQLQSTSDQQDFLKYPPIVAAAPLMVLPEQAASWAYPQPGMSAEEVSFCLVTGLLGRFFLSGYLNQMAPVERELVDEAVRLAKALRHDISTSTPFWPLGLPRWDDPWVALGLTAGETRYIALWNRDADVPATSLKLLGHGVHSAEFLETIFPQSLAGWQTEWDEEGGTLRVLNPTRSIGARAFRITATDLASTTSHTTIL